MAPPPRGRFRRWLRRALIGLVAITLGLLFVLHLPPVQQWLVSTALSSLRTRQSLDLTWRDVSFNLVTRSAQIQGLRLGARAPRRRWSPPNRSRCEFPFGLFRGKLDGLDVTLVNGTVTLAREKGQWSTIPAAWTRSTPGSPPRSLPAFAALRLHDIAVVYDDRDARFRTETKGLRVDLLPTGICPRRSGWRPGGWRHHGRALGTARHDADVARRPRVFLAWRRRREAVAAGRTRRAHHHSSRRSCALPSRAPIASR